MYVSVFCIVVEKFLNVVLIIEEVGISVCVSKYLFGLLVI